MTTDADLLGGIVAFASSLDPPSRQVVLDLAGHLYDLQVRISTEEVGHAMCEAGLCARRADRVEALTGSYWPLGTTEKAADLDRLGVPLDANRSQAREALRAAGMSVGRWEVLAAALRYRRQSDDAAV